MTPAPSLLDGVMELLTPERTRTILLGLRTGYFVLLGWLLLRVVCVRIPGYRQSGRGLWLVMLLFIAAALGILAYQATWQLTGFVRPQFMTFMERYNPRPTNAARRLVRGRIFDSHGREVAVSDPDAPGYRRYPFGAATAHLVGYRHPIYGVTGIEGAADALVSGYMIESRDDWERVGRTALREHREVGTNLVLTVDAELQAFAYAQFAGRAGAVVALDPNDGSVLLLVTSPSFDPNQFAPSLNRDSTLPLLNRALHGRYPPGSTFKLAIAALMVEQKVNTTLYCPAEGYVAPGSRRPIRDHEYYEFERRGLTWGGFGAMDLATAFAKSSNSYFAQAGVLSGVEAFNILAERLWINARIPLYDGPSGMISSQRGNVPILGRGERRELAQLSIGQGRLLATPLHMAMLAATVAADGKLWNPRLLATEPPRPLPPTMRKETARHVARIMREAVQRGTGRSADLPGLDVCGKTGTAQNPGGDDHAWFVCFAPEANPQLAMAVLVENAGFGSRSAVPVAAAILAEAQARGYFGGTPGPREATP